MYMYMCILVGILSALIDPGQGRRVMASRSLFQQWIKPAENDPVKQEEPHKKVDKKTSQKMWGDIFKKPKPPKEPDHSEPIPAAPTPPTNEFNEHTAPEIQHEMESIETPSFMHVFKLEPEQLRQVKPKKVHSFFAKRNTTVVPVTAKRFVKQIERHAPFDTVNLRAPQSWEHRSLKRRRRNSHISNNPSSDPRRGEINQFLSPQLTMQSAQKFMLPQLHSSKRTLQSPQQLKAICGFNQCADFAELVSEKNMFDLGQFETRMWCEKYQPKSWNQHVNSEPTKMVVDWVRNQFKMRPKVLQQIGAHKRRKTPSNSFVVDDDMDEEIEQTSDMLVINGGTGSGKTSAVYAACASLDAFVFEVNSAMKRTGKELSSVLDGISMNHAVHKANNVVILVDDGDVVYENEAGTFWATIQRFATVSKRPVILTCTDPRMLAFSGIQIDQIQFPIPPGVRVMDIAWSIALAEGHLLDKTKVAHLVVQAKADLRKVLTELQFWCQMGIGGHPSGTDWVPKEVERDYRVISQTWIPHDGSDKTKTDSDTSGGDAESRFESIENNSVEAFLARETEKHEQVPQFRAPPEETISIPNALVLPNWTEPVLCHERGNEFAAFKSLPYGLVAINTQIKPLVSDVLPMIRYMAASDYNRVTKIQHILKDRSMREARMLQRTWNSQGYDLRSYLELPIANLQQILEQCFNGFQYTFREVKLPEWFERAPAVANMMDDSPNVTQEEVIPPTQETLDQTQESTLHDSQEIHSGSETE